MRLALTKLERNVLIRKKTNQGMDYYKAKEEVKKINEYLREMVLKLMRKGKSEQEIEDKFKKEFELICMKSEV